MPAPVRAGAPGGNREPERPLVSMEGWARFEQRARERRIEKRLAAARAAISSREFAAARDALTELAELNPSHPEIEPLTLQLVRAQTSRRPHRGRFAVAATAFATVMLAASWVGNTGLLQSYPIVETAALAPAPEALLTSRAIALDFPIATTGEPETALADTIAGVTDAVPVSFSAGPASWPVPQAVAVSPQLDLPPASAGEPLYVPPPVSRTTPPPPIAAEAAPAAAAPVDAAAVVDDAAQVRALLQKYQAAYERLDAGLVRAVWPGVNQSALTRAFAGLEAQALTFRACDVQLRGATANAVCTGSTRYVPKIGSREPRVESLAWTFTLRKKAGDEWEIETARAER